MKILMDANFFYPIVGGTTIMSDLLAREFLKFGHSVTLTTSTQTNSLLDDSIFPYKVVRQPSPIKFFKLVKKADVFYQRPFSLKSIWAPLILSKKASCSYVGIIPRTGIINQLKHLLLPKISVISVSSAVAQDLSFPSAIIPNSYRTDIFFNSNPYNLRKKELIFVGRLVSEKGADILLSAIRILKEKKSIVNLTIVGDGPEINNLKTQASHENIENQVTFLGKLTGKELAKELNKHIVQVIPSNYVEAFGIVALEGIACGCAIIASNTGGLMGAAGDCAVYFKMGDSFDLAEKIGQLVFQRSNIDPLRKNFSSHLDKHKPQKIAQRYLEVMVNGICRARE